MLILFTIYLLQKLSSSDKNLIENENVSIQKMLASNVHPIISYNVIMDKTFSFIFRRSSELRPHPNRRVA